MVINDFKINITDVTERSYVPRGKRAKPGEEGKPRKMFSFTLDWQGLIEGEDALSEESYVGSQHKGCMFYHVSQQELDWGYPKTLAGGGRQIQPSKPNVGLRKRVLAALLRTVWAETLLEDAKSVREDLIPDPEKFEKERLEIS